MVRLERRVLDTVPAGGDAMRMNRGLARGRCWVGVRSVQLLQPPVHTVCRGCLSMHAHAVHGDTDTVSVAMTTSCVSLQLVYRFLVFAPTARVCPVVQRLGGESTVHVSRLQRRGHFVSRRGHAARCHVDWRRWSFRVQRSVRFYPGVSGGGEKWPFV